MRRVGPQRIGLVYADTCGGCRTYLANYESLPVEIQEVMMLHYQPPPGWHNRGYAWAHGLTVRHLSERPQRRERHWTA